MRLQLDPLPSFSKCDLPGILFRSTKWNSSVCILAVAVSLTGCRSSMPKLGMFGFKSEPSPEAIAGVGPTATYPVSPSTTVAPESIASAAAGTAPSGMKPQTAAYAAVAPGPTTPSASVTPGTPAVAASTTSPTNPAAAAANGFYDNLGKPSSTSALPAGSSTVGYAYGKSPQSMNNLAATTPSATAPPATAGDVNALTAGYVAPPKPATTSGVPAYAQSSTTSPATSPIATSPSANFAAVGYPLPGTSSTQSPTPSSAPSTAISSDPPAPINTAPGFAMPPIAAASTAAPSAPSSAPSSAGGFTMPTGDVPGPAATVAAAPSTPSSEPVVQQAAVPSTSSSFTAPASGYKPGSTAGAVSYPSSGYPSTNNSDSFYR